MNANARILLNHAFALPNAPGVANNFVYNFPSPENWRQDLVRIDHNFTTNTRANFRMIRESWDARRTQSYDTIWQEWYLPAGNYGGRVTKVVNPTMVTDFSFNYAYNYGPRDKATIRSAGNYVRPSDDLRPRTLETARNARGKRRWSKQIAAAAAAARSCYRPFPTAGRYAAPRSRRRAYR